MSLIRNSSSQNSAIPPRRSLRAGFEAVATDDRPKSKFPFKKLIIGVLLVVILGGLGWVGYKFLLKNKDNADQDGGYPTEKLVMDISKHYLLPEGEEPSNILVKDPAELKSEPFFDGALAGDRVLLYPKTGLIILYRPELDKIVKAGSITGNEKKADTASAQNQAPVIPTVYFLNGSTVAGITKTAEAAVTAAGIQYSFVGRDNAVLKSYVKTLVVDVSGKNGDVASKIANALGGVTGALPSGETAPIGADILVFVAP